MSYKHNLKTVQMKRLLIAALLIVGLSSFAQDKKEIEKKGNRSPMEQFTPEQRNQLALKKMTLELDLNAKQQEQMKQIIAEQSAKREAMKASRKENKPKPTSDELFAMKNKRLDEQIAMKAKMKTILSPEQFEKWNALKESREHKRNHPRGERKAAVKKQI
jgi:Spy/CpxP family protein refolding chaperone